MARVTGPLFSLGASGAVGKAIVFSIWKGRPYVRQLVTPSNPKSGGQTGMRSMFAFLSQVWAGLSAANKATWESRAADKTVSPFNAFMSRNQELWRDYLPPTKEDAASGGGTASTITNEAAVAGERSITLSWDTGAGAEQWGVVIYRSTAPFTATWDNAIKVVTSAASQVGELIIDSPLDPGTYYYQIRPYTDDNTWGTISAEVNATVT